MYDEDRETVQKRFADRRSFLRWTGGAAVAVAWPDHLERLARRLAPVPPDGALPWQSLRDEFLIPEDRVYLNVGTLGPQPRVVVDAVNEVTRRVAETYPPSVDWDALKSLLADLVGCDPAGLVFPRNTTEGMSFVAAGLELEAGDEILTTDHEHIGGLSCWELAARRHRLVLRPLTLPVPATDPDEIVDLFAGAITARTRVVSISHLTFTNGTILPVERIARLCRERGVISVIDGAHPPGLMPLDLDGIGADFYASSPHKWLMAPQGTGFLYMAERWRTELWPTLASGGWDDLSLGAQRFNHMGTIDASRLVGLEAALRFHAAIGTATVSRRLRALRARLVESLLEDPRIRILTPALDGLAAGMVSFVVDGLPSSELQRRLATDANVRTRVIGEYDLGWMRLSPHVYNTEDELDRVAERIRTYR